MIKFADSIFAMVGGIASIIVGLTDLNKETNQWLVIMGAIMFVIFFINFILILHDSNVKVNNLTYSKGVN